MDEDTNSVNPEAILHVSILAPTYKKELMFEGIAKSFSSFNDEGTFDILPMHENFVTLISKKITIIDSNGNPRQFDVGKGLLEANNNEVKVFLEF